MGGLLCQAYTDVAHVPARRAERWLPPPAALSQGNAAILLRSRSPQLCPLPELVCAIDGAPSPACQGGPTSRCTRLSALGWGTAVPADQFREHAYIKRGKGSGVLEVWRAFQGAPSKWLCGWIVSVCVPTLTSPWNIICTMKQKQHNEVYGEETNKHKDEGEGRRRLDEADRKKIAVELEK